MTQSSQFNIKPKGFCNSRNQRGSTRVDGTTQTLKNRPTYIDSEQPKQHPCVGEYALGFITTLVVLWNRDEKDLFCIGVPTYTDTFDGDFTDELLRRCFVEIQETEGPVKA
ncbi:hypothetical protein JHK86_047709 [Glycine max]|nr:hypothetical protein JHK86_047709 [Glycine max]